MAALSAFEAKAREWIRSIEAAETEKRFLGAHPRARHYADELRGDRERLLTEIGDRIAQTREGNPDHTRIADLIRAWTHHVESIARIEARASN
ncbi:MAG: hypothetical protein CME06_13025 [Gemmatimonadetes bacterium]|nr:hypothetical protein [Gemmatimonadota bacterium]